MENLEATTNDRFEPYSESKEMKVINVGDVIEFFNNDSKPLTTKICYGEQGWNGDTVNFPVEIIFTRSLFGGLVKVFD